MSTRTTITKLMQVSDVKDKLLSLVDDVRSHETRILIARDGVPVAALVSVEDLDEIRDGCGERDRRFAIIDEMREAFKDVPAEEIEREVVAMVRQIRESDEAARRAGERIDVERRPA